MTATESGDDVVQSLPLLAFLAPEVRDLVAASFVPVSFPFGAVIFAEGDAGDAVYVVTKGRARVLKSGENGEVSLNVLGPGDSFGETALLTGAPRSATVRAGSRLDALRLDAGVFRALVARDPRIAESFELAVRRQALGDLLRLSSPFASLPTEGLADLLRELRPVEVTAGEVVCRQGDEGHALHIVEDGRLRAFQTDDDDGTERDIAFLGVGDVVGERSLLTGSAVSATVVALSDCRLLCLDRTSFTRLLDDHPTFREQIAARVAQYDYRRHARVPLDFAEELLPAEAAADAPPADEAAPFDTGDRVFVKREPRLRRFPHIRQVDEADCGAAALAMVCRHFGARVSLARVRQVVGTGIDGTSLRGLARGAEALGLAARALKVSRRNVDAMPLPAIVHWKGNHWVVVFDVDETHVRIADPALGVRKLPRTELDEAWSGYAVLFARTDRVDELEASPSGFAWLRPFVRKYWRPIAGATALAMVVSALQLALPVLISVVVDRVLPPRDFDLLQVLVLAMSGVFVVSVLASYVQRFILSRAAVGMDAETLDFVAGKMVALPMTYY